MEKNVGRKKDNNFAVQRGSDAINAAFNHGMAVQRVHDATAVANQTNAHLQHTIGLLNEVIIIPPKKEQN